MHAPYSRDQTTLLVWCGSMGVISRDAAVIGNANISDSICQASRDRRMPPARGCCRPRLAMQVVVCEPRGPPVMGVHGRPSTVDSKFAAGRSCCVLHPLEIGLQDTSDYNSGRLCLKVTIWPKPTTGVRAVVLCATGRNLDLCCQASCAPALWTWA